MFRIVAIACILIFFLWAIDYYSAIPPQECARGTSGIQWDEVRNNFVDQSQRTTIQRLDSDRQKHLWNSSFKGKRVCWSGIVKDVQKEADNCVQIDIDMGVGSFGADIWLRLEPNVSETARRLSKGTRISFSGSLDEQPGYWIPLIMQQGIVYGGNR